MALIANPISHLKSLQAKLQTEREDRKKTEEEACKLLKQYKSKYDASIKEKGEIIHDLKKQVEAEKHRNERLEQEKNDALDQLESVKEQLKRLEDRGAKRSRPKSPSKATCRERSSSRKRRESGHQLTSVASGLVTDDLVKEVERLTEELKCLQAEMEAKDAEVARSKERAQFSREINIELRTEKAELAKLNSELQTKLDAAAHECEERIKAEVESTKKARKELEKKLREEERNRDQLMVDIKTLKKIIKEKNEEVEKHLGEVNRLKEHEENYRKVKDEEFDRKYSKFEKKIKDLQHQLDQKTKDLKKSASDFKTLKEAYTENDKQAEELETRLEKKKSECSKLTSDLRAVQKERDELKSELKRLNDSLNVGAKENKSEAKRFNDEIKRLEGIVEEYKLIVQQLEERLDNERIVAQENIDRADRVQQELDDTALLSNDYMNRVSNLEHELREVKEEAARHVTAYLEEKSKVTQLKRQLATAHENMEALEAKVQSLIHKLERQKVANETEVFRLEERLRQHHQAEKEMMGRIEKLEQKKKPYFGINSPALSKKGPRSAPPVQLGGSKDAESQLQVEREANRRLQQQLIRTETELLDLKMELKMTRVNDFEDDGAGSQATSPSAPPPPYPYSNHRHDDDRSHSPSTNSATSTASSSDNNLPTMDDNDYLDVDRAVRGAGWRVRADVHHRVSEVEEEDEDEDRPGEFTFTESALNLIENTSPMKRVNK